MLIIAGSVAVVHADQYDVQINNLKSQNNKVQSTINSLQSEAVTYKSAVNQLQSEVYTVQQQINFNIAKQAELEQQIIEEQVQIDLNRAYLASAIKAMYVDGSPSTIEELATSNNLSDFVDKQEYRNLVQRNVNDILQKVQALKDELQAQKIEIDQLLRDQADQRKQLSSNLYQQGQLLSYNVNQQAGYSQQLKDNQSRIAILRAQQAAAYARATGTGGRSPVGYPIKYKNMSAAQVCGGGYEYCYNSNGTLTYIDQWVNDPWGFHYARECVHYAIDVLKVRGYYTGGHWPPSSGSAYQWVGYTTRNGLAVLVTDPAPGDVVYIPVGSLGHVAVVEWKNNDGTVHVSQMNWTRGKYSTMDLYLSSPGLQFMRFHR